MSHVIEYIIYEPILAVEHQYLSRLLLSTYRIVFITRRSQLSDPYELIPFSAQRSLLVTQSVKPFVNYIQHLQCYTLLQRLQSQAVETSGLLALQVEVGLNVFADRYYGGPMSVS